MDFIETSEIPRRLIEAFVVYEKRIRELEHRVNCLEGNHSEDFYVKNPGKRNTIFGFVNTEITTCGKCGKKIKEMDVKV